MFHVRIYAYLEGVPSDRFVEELTTHERVEYDQEYFNGQTEIVLAKYIPWPDALPLPRVGESYNTQKLSEEVPQGLLLFEVDPQEPFEDTAYVSLLVESIEHFVESKTVLLRTRILHPTDVAVLQELGWVSNEPEEFVQRYLEFLSREQVPEDDDEMDVYED